jgi:hypothetical protein
MVKAAPASVNATSTTAPAINAERAAMLHRSGLSRETLRRRTGAWTVGSARCPSIDRDVAVRRGLASTALALRLPVSVDIPLLRGNQLVPCLYGATTLSLAGIEADSRPKASTAVSAFLQR